MVWCVAWFVCVCVCVCFLLPICTLSCVRAVFAFAALATRKVWLSVLPRERKLVYRVSGGVDACKLLDRCVSSCEWKCGSWKLLHLCSLLVSRNVVSSCEWKCGSWKLLHLCSLLLSRNVVSSCEWKCGSWKLLHLCSPPLESRCGRIQTSALACLIFWVWTHASFRTACLIL